MDGESNQELAKATGELAKTVGKAIDVGREGGGFLAEFLRPPLRELSGMLTDSLQHTRLLRAIELQRRAQEKLDALGSSVVLREIPASFAVPLIEAASLEESAEVRDLWANLLVNAANKASSTHPEKAFVTVLRDFGPLEFQVFQMIYSTPEADAHCVLTVGLPERVEFELPQVEGEPIFHPKKPTKAVTLALANLFRLQCLQTAKLMGGPDVYGTVYTTTFGRALHSACTNVEMPFDESE